VAKTPRFPTAIEPILIVLHVENWNITLIAIDITYATLGITNAMTMPGRISKDTIHMAIIAIKSEVIMAMAVLDVSFVEDESILTVDGRS